MVNQIVPIGTGMVKLIYDPKKQNKEWVLKLYINTDLFE
jgi:hypothetical protein